MSRKKVFYIAFFAALIAAFYVTLTALIPDFGTKKTKTISTVKPFAFRNQDGKLVTDQDVAGKVYVAEFFFTTCKSICPIMNKNMRVVYDELKDEKDFLILSHTSDPETDSVPRLKWYADSMKVSTDKWIFLTGRKDSLYNMARSSYIVADPNNNFVSVEDDFLHTQLWAVVDKHGNVRRKSYDGLKMAEVKEMIRDIKKLLKE